MGDGGAGINVDDASKEPRGREAARIAAKAGDREGVYLGLLEAAGGGEGVTIFQVSELLLEADKAALLKHSREAEIARRNGEMEEYAGA